MALISTYSLFDILDLNQLMIPAMYKICSEMVERWEEIVSTKESCELDIWPELQTMAANVISLTAFGANYEDGRRVFELQYEQAEHAMELRHSVYFPGGRCFYLFIII